METIKDFKVPKSDNIFFTNGNVYRISKNPAKGFNFDYLLYIPNGITSKSTLFVEGANTGKKLKTIEEGTNDVYYDFLRNNLPTKEIAIKQQLPLLMPLFPRFYDKENDIPQYTHSLSSYTLFETRYGLKRIDNQLIEMINDAKKKLKPLNIEVDEKIIIAGFSASSKFANRFTMLHPEIVKLCVAGGTSGGLILPLREINGEKLLYPFGIGNLPEVTDDKIEQFLKVKQFYYNGLVDNNDPYIAKSIDSFEPKYVGMVTKESLEQLYRYLGRDINARIAKNEEYYQNLNVNAIFKNYPNVGHDPHPAKDDIEKVIIDTIKEKVI